jgi:hypothetical protein
MRCANRKWKQFQNISFAEFALFGTSLLNGLLLFKLEKLNEVQIEMYNFP